MDFEELERAKGIEPSYAAWEAAVLPLNYARKHTFADFWLRFGSAFIRQTSADRKPESAVAQRGGLSCRGTVTPDRL
jgi:hypothetical protein